MKNTIKNWISSYLLGFKSKNNEPSFIEQKPNIRTTYPNSHMGFNEWAQNLKVSQLYQR
jgi:hypothetical protein